MGLFISTCKNCKELIHWFVTTGDKVCVYCMAENTVTDLYATKLNQEQLNDRKRVYQDRKLYDKEIQDYIKEENAE